MVHVKTQIIISFTKLRTNYWILLTTKLNKALVLFVYKQLFDGSQTDRPTEITQREYSLKKKKKYLPNEILAMAAKSWMFEKSWNELVILYFRYILLFKGSFSCSVSFTNISFEESGCISYSEDFLNFRF